MQPTVPNEPRIDYVERWRRLVQARVDQGRRLDRTHDRGDHWAGERAARFRRMAAQPRSDDALLNFLRPRIGPTTTVLDVGAGTGRYVPPLAPLVAKMTALEPSPAMRTELENVVREADLSNVEVVPASWPDGEVAPADLVICSHVAYFVPDIEPFIRRLDGVNRGCCVVVLRHVQREIAILDLFEQVWGEPRCPEPTFTDLFGVASQLGIWANVLNVPFMTVAGFPTFEDAVTMVKADLLNPEGADVEQKIRRYLGERMVQRDGRWTFATPPTYAGMLWWEAKS